MARFAAATCMSLFVAIAIDTLWSFSFWYFSFAMLSTEWPVNSMSIVVTFGMQALPQFFHPEDTPCSLLLMIGEDIQRKLLTCPLSGDDFENKIDNKQVIALFHFV